MSTSDESQEVWTYNATGDLIEDADGFLVADEVPAQYGPRIAAVPALERLLRKYLTQHDTTYARPGRRCQCGWCCEARGLLGEAAT